MAVKTRDQLKGENASDFPDNTARLISPADLRGQMDDIVDSALFPEDGLVGEPGPPGPAGDVRFVASIAAMRALTGLSPGSIVFVGSRMDQFVVVDDDTLGPDGGTVFIPDSELSEYLEEQIPWSLGDHLPPPVTIGTPYQLDHTGIDFESVELIMTDDDHPTYPRETFSIWMMHGHTMSPGYTDRQFCPQLPMIQCGEGHFHDPGGWMTGFAGGHANWPHIREGGVLLRYKYALSGLRLKRVRSGTEFHLRWWPVVAVDEEEEGEETDNGGKICWCFNAAAKPTEAHLSGAGASAVIIDKMYYFQGAVEIPDGLELRGHGIGISGFKAMSNSACRELLLSISMEPDNLWKEYTAPTFVTAVNHTWTYLLRSGAYGTAFFPASGASRMRIIDLEFDGNIANNFGIFSQRGPSAIHADPPAAAPGPYAYGSTMGGILFNVPVHGGIMLTSHGSRVIPAQGDLELHNVKIHGWISQVLLTSAGWRTSSTGLLELGDTYPGHQLYTVDGEFETVRCFGYASNDLIRTRKFICQSLEFHLYPPPDFMFTLGDYPRKHATDPNLPGVLLADPYGPDGAGWKIECLTYSGIPPQSQYGGASGDYPWPQLMPHRISIDYLFVDASRLDEIPDGAKYMPMLIFGASGDNIHVKSGKVRFGNKVQALSQPFIGAGNIQPGQPTINNSIENLVIEYGSRLGVQLFSNTNYHQANFRNITFEPRAATHLLNTPGNGSNILMTLSPFELIPKEPPNNQYSHGGRFIEFSACVVADLSGKYIDITHTEAEAPLLRVWFNVTGAASVTPPADGRTLIPVTIAAAATTAQVAAAFSDAIEDTATAKLYFTVATFATASVIGNYSSWQSEVYGNIPLVNVTNTVNPATGIVWMRGTVANTAELTALAVDVSPVPNVGDGYLVRDEAAPQHLWVWNGTVFADAGVFSGVSMRMRQARRIFEPSSINFERIVAQDPTYQSLISLGTSTAAAVGANRDITVNFKECVFGAAGASFVSAGGTTGAFVATVPPPFGGPTEVRDRVHLNFEDTVFDIRDGIIYTNLDLMLYAGKYRGCRVRTPTISTGLTTMGTGYEMLVSEQSDVYTVTPGVTAGTTTTTIDIQTKLFWLPKPGNIRLYPADAAAAVVWNTNMPSVEWRKSARPITTTSTALGGGGAYYTVNEDRRAPVLRLNFASALAAAELKIGWSAAVSP